MYTFPPFQGSRLYDPLRVPSQSPVFMRSATSATRNRSKSIYLGRFCEGYALPSKRARRGKSFPPRTSGVGLLGTDHRKY